MAYDPEYINFDVNPWDEAAALAELQADVSERINEGLEPIIIGGPVITRPPQDTSGAVDDTAIFTITAIGTAPLTYVWQINTGSGWAPTGGTAKTYSVTITAALDGAQYRCIVTDGNGVRTASQAATLTVVL